jgi:hypothetical protein
VHVVFSPVSDLEPPAEFAPPPTTVGAPGPPPIPPIPTVLPSRPPQPGELTAPWRTAMIVTWVGVFIAYMAVWKASEEIGIATWWLGARSNPQPVYVRIVPFVVSVVFGILSGYNVKKLPWINLGGAGVLALIAVPDLSRSPGLATIEFAIAGAVALVSLGSFTGTYRAAAPDGDR